MRTLASVVTECGTFEQELLDGERADGEPDRSPDRRRLDELTARAVEKARTALPAP